MNKKSKRIFSPIRTAILGCVILAMLHIILLGGAYLRRAAVGKIQSDRAALDQNYAALKQINEEQLSALQSELELIQAEVDELQSSFPVLGAPFAIYHRGMDLSQSSGVGLDSISHLGSDLQETVSGNIQTDNYSIELTGLLKSCLTFIQKLERAGMDTLTMEYASIWPEEELCSLGIKTVGYPGAEE
jgi:hypothetical protein